MRISVASLGEEDNRRFVDQVRLCELLGFAGAFHADEKWTRDVYVRQGMAAASTSRIRLGISVTDPYTRHPGLTAQATATLGEACEGRLTVVMGAGSHFETLPGYVQRKPVTAVREAIEVIRKLWAGERVWLDGEIVKIEGARLDWDPNPQHLPQLWVAGRSPKILEMAGGSADGVLMGSFATKPAVNYARDRIEAGLSASGRTWEDITLAAWVYVSILDDEEATIPDNVFRGVSHAMWSSRNFFKEHLDDFADDISDEFRTFMHEAPHAWSPEVMAELRSKISPGTFESLAIVGTADQVAARVEALRAAGVQELVIWPFPREGEAVEDLITKIAHALLPSIAETRELAGYRLVD
jgi:5,10-methylenetetrahydromethanopterin reductase